MPAAYTVRKAANGQFYFNLTAENSQKILASETYTEKANALKGIESVRANSPLDERYQRKTSADGKPYFVLVAANNQVIGQSEMYSSDQAMENGIASVKRNGPEAPIKDET
jgi:uncharacterized protein YegP (UPF0339 family)